MISRNDLRALRNMLDEARLILNTTTLPEGRAGRAKELLESSIALTDQLIASPTVAAAALGKKGGLKTAKRGPEYFKSIAAMRKTRAGGRPKKQES